MSILQLSAVHKRQLVFGVGASYNKMKTENLGWGQIPLKTIYNIHCNTFEKQYYLSIYE